MKEYPKEWFARRADIEGDAEVGAGIPPTHRSTYTRPPPPDAIDTRIALGQFVELWRRNKGWNPERLANEAGIDTSEILEIEQDPHCSPEPSAIFKLAHVFGVPPRRLLEIAGLVNDRTPLLRESAIRFAATSKPISSLSEEEREALEAFVAALSASTKS